MLSDEQLIDRLRFELAPLRPPADLAERVRAQAGTRSRPGLLRRPMGRALVAVTVMAVAVVAVVLVLAGGRAAPTRTSPISSVHNRVRSTLPRARAGGGQVVCFSGMACRQGDHAVRNPSGSSCGAGRLWSADGAVPGTKYGCHATAMAGY
jgi:hypothetical protein